VKCYEVIFKTIFLKQILISFLFLLRNGNYVKINKKNIHKKI